MINLSLDTKVELSFAPDLSAHPLTWSWVDISNRKTAGSRAKVHPESFSVRRGRADNTSVSEPAEFRCVVDNPDGALTPHNPTSLWYPNVDVDGPILLRSWIKAGSPHLTTSGASGSRAGTPDHADLDITTDWTLIVELLPPMLLPPPGGNYEIIGKFNVSGSQRSVLLFVDSAGILRLRWSTDGTGTGELNANSSEAITLTDSGPLVLAAWLDVNNGAGGRTTTFYECPGSLTEFLADPSSFVLGIPDTDSGTTSVFASTAPLDVGDVTGSGFSPYPGKYRRVQVRAGDPSTGAVRANPDFTLAAVGATSLVDSTGKTWTFQGDANIDKWRLRFVGEVSAIAPSWPTGNLPGFAQVQLTAAGMTRRMRQGTKNPQSALFRRITAPVTSPTRWAYWPGEDGRDSEQAYSPFAGVDPGVIDMSLAADDSLAASKPLPQSSQDFGYSFPVPPTVSTTQWEITKMVRIPTAQTGSETPLLRVDATGSIARWDVSINDTTVRIQAADTNGNSLLNSANGSDSRFFGTWMIVTLFVTQNGADVDWDLHLTPVPGGLIFSYVGTVTTDTCGRPTRIHNDGDAPPDGISFGHWIVTTGAGTGWLAPADTAYVGEPDVARVARLCAEYGIRVIVDGPTTSASQWATALADGAEAMGPQRPLTLSELLEECAATGFALLNEQRSGHGLYYRSRASRYNQTPRLVLDYAQGHVPEPFRPTADDQRKRNDVTVSRVDGSSHREFDPDAEAGKKPLYDEQVTVNVHKDTAVPDQAGWRFLLGTWPGMRYPTIPADIGFNQTALADDWLDATEGDVAQLVNLPPEHPPGGVDLVIEGSDDRWSQYSWDPELSCSPAGPWTVGVLDSDRLDTDGSELAVAVNSSATTWSVATVSGPKWTTENAETPFDIAAAGEEVTVTDIADVLVTFGAAGTASHAVNADVTPGLPTSVAAGNLLLVFAAIRNSGAGVPNTPTGYTRLPVFPSDSNAQLFAKIAGSSESAPTISFTGGVANADTSAQMIRLGGSYYGVDNLIAEQVTILNGSNQNIPYPALEIYEDNLIVLYLAWKQAAWTSVATIAGATEIGEPDTGAGDDQGLVWDYVIQTTAADIPAGSFAVTGGVAAISRGAVIALRSDVQTFTVTRSANGVSKSHAAGTAVALADPLRLAL